MFSINFSILNLVIVLKAQNLRADVYKWTSESTECDEWKWKWPKRWSDTTPTLKFSIVFAFAVSYVMCVCVCSLLPLSLLVSGSLSFLTDLHILRLWLLVLFQHHCITLCHLPPHLSLSLSLTHIPTRLSRLSSLHHRWGWWAVQPDTTDPAIFKCYACLIPGREIIPPICALRSLSSFCFLFSLFPLLINLDTGQFVYMDSCIYQQ